MKDQQRLEKLELGTTTKPRLFVWRVRRNLRNWLGGHDILAHDKPQSTSRSKQAVREIYRKTDAFVSRRMARLVQATPRDVAITMLSDAIDEMGYTVVEKDLAKPWGCYFRMNNDDAERFVAEFFPDLNIVEAKLGRDDVELSPKLLLVQPGHRLSWQYHNRRAERWRFLTDGAYYRSHSDIMPGKTIASAGTVVQFDAGERHRLASGNDEHNYTLVAEIWQHTVAGHPSDEPDIVRLEDDYSR
jgi:mannose-6-phosphate isomerase